MVIYVCTRSCRTVALFSNSNDIPMLQLPSAFCNIPCMYNSMLSDMYDNHAAVQSSGLEPNDSRYFW